MTKSIFCYELNQIAIIITGIRPPNIELCVVFQRIPMKDFSAEVRATMDVENYLNQATLILDLHEHSVEDILNQMLSRMLKNEEKDFNEALEDAKKSLFTHDSGKG